MVHHLRREQRKKCHWIAIVIAANNNLKHNNLKVVDTKRYMTNSTTIANADRVLLRKQKKH